MHPFEKLGAFYLGRTYDAATKQTLNEPLLYDAKDLTTHAVCLGMTGSGKTGLCVSLLEEAGIDGIPAIAVDLKGDIASLMLTFPQLRPEDFAPWVEQGANRDQDSAAVADQQTAGAQAAELWRTGLARWDQDGARIARFREAVDLAIYTPGSDSGRQLAALRSFDAPPAAILGDDEAFIDRVESTVSSLLGLLGIDADPLQSREHILLSNVLSHAWRSGANLDMPGLIAAVQHPPFDTLGVMRLDTFFPAKDRQALALRINGLLAAPATARWARGEPLDIEGLLYTSEGKPRISIISIAHLSEDERMFFMTLLLSEIVSWVRTQPGTNSLRALLYVDEVFGFFPPSAEPPAKRPMLTLLKQARAYGLGVVLATQNPVDLDYKGLGNTGTWFLGRLQTERDRARVIEGLQGLASSAGAPFDRAELQRCLSGLGKRVFLLNNVHDAQPQLFHTRWALSYLRGPLTRNEIRRLNETQGAEPTNASSEVSRPATPPLLLPPTQPITAQAAPSATGSARPVLPDGVEERFLRVAPHANTQRVVYKPMLWGTANLHFVRSQNGLDEWQKRVLAHPLGTDHDSLDWEQALGVVAPYPEMETQCPSGTRFETLSKRASTHKKLLSALRKLKTHLYRSEALLLWECRQLKLVSTPGEAPGAFRRRAGQLARERRDEQLDKLRTRYQTRLTRVEERLRKAAQRLERERGELSQVKTQTVASVGATVLGALFGRKLASRTNVRGVSAAMRSATRISRQRGDIARAEQNLAKAEEALAELESRFRAQLQELQDKLSPADLEISEIRVRPRKADIEIGDPLILWVPWETTPEGQLQPACHHPLDSRQ